MDIKQENIILISTIFVTSFTALTVGIVIKLINNIKLAINEKGAEVRSSNVTTNNV